MKIEIWSDVACPFCYIGKRKFEKALAQFDHSEVVEIEWKSFQLDPTIPENVDQSIGMYQYLANNKGISLSDSKNMHDNVSRIATDVGLNYDFDNAKISNTLDASRLMHFAKTFGKQSELKEKLLAAHFTDGLDVADTQVLVQIGESEGMDGEEIRRMLNSDDFKMDVKNDIQEAQNLGITGVPFFVFDRKYGISGAQDPSVFLETLEKAFSESFNE